MATNGITSFDPSDELLPNIVDHYATVKLNALYSEYPISQFSYDEGYRKITYRELANAVNGVALWLTDTLGPGRTFEKLAYIGPNDLRYPVLILGAVKAGYCMFFTSPRNSVAAHLSLLDQVQCEVMICPTPQPPATRAILRARRLRALEIPSVESLLGVEYPHFTFEKTLSQAAAEPLVIVHTSGSTGTPKPMTWTHETASIGMKTIAMDPPDGYESQSRLLWGKRVFLTFPPFHAAYLAKHLYHSIPYNIVMIAPISAGIPSAAGLVEGLKQSPADVACIVPSIVQELAEDPELLDYCSKNLELITYSGGDLPEDIGNIVADKVRLMNQFGATELGTAPHVFSRSDYNPKDWKYVEFHPMLHMEFHHIANETYELRMIRNQRAEHKQVLFTYAGFSDLQEYATRDLFVQHPERKNLWKWHARLDDIQVFLNGEKTNPISMEQHILSHNAEVSGVLVVGTRRFQAALLVEPVPGLSSDERMGLLERIWPSIEEANHDCPAHAHIFQSHMLFTSPEKPMLRAGKGTIQRAGTVDLYEQELDELYRNVEMNQEKDNASGPGPAAGYDEVAQFIRETVISITEWAGELDKSENFFLKGIDSLQAITIARKLRRGLDSDIVSVSLVYMHPSVSGLARAITKLRARRPSILQAMSNDRLQQKHETLKIYQEMIDRIPWPSQQPVSMEKHHIILTGSTGFIGSHLLQTLLAHPSVEHVYCLNRRHFTLAARQETNQSRGLETYLDQSQVTFLTADLSQDNLNLPPETLQELLEKTTILIHNAWPVNFNLSPASFNPQLAGLVNLINFCASAVTRPQLFFTSPISSVQGHQTPSLTTPEELVTTSTANTNGYAESKCLAEQLLGYAAQKLPVHVSIARLGQIAGAVLGTSIWNPAEWFPSLVLSSVHMGAIPDMLGPMVERIDWVPVDLLSGVLVELALGDTETQGNNPVQVFHPHNLHPRTWESTRGIVVDKVRAISGKELEVIPLDTWIERIHQEMEAVTRDHQAEGDSLQGLLGSNPAAKLLDFFQGMLGVQGPCNILETRRTERSSGMLSRIPGVRDEWIRKWVREWMQS